MNKEQDLCVACGLCCDGTLFSWVKLRPGELGPARQAGLAVYGDEPADRGFPQPCAVFSGRCGIYTTSAYPKACGAFRCSILNELAGGKLSFTQAAEKITAFKGLAQRVREALPNTESNLREKVVAAVEGGSELDPKTNALLWDYAAKAREWFGVKDVSPVFDKPQK